MQKQLDAKEQLQLFLKYKTSQDPKSRAALIVANTRLILKKVSKMARKDLRGDLVQEAFMGALVCLDKFDPSKGANWATYSMQWGLARQLVFLSKNSSVMSGLFSTRKGAKLFPLLHKHASDEAVVSAAQRKAVEVTAEEVICLRAATGITSEEELEEVTVEPEMHDVFMKTRVQEALAKIMPVLSDREKDLLENIMGENIPLAQLAKKWGCSPQALFQNRDKLFRKLRPLLKKFV